MNKLLNNYAIDLWIAQDDLEGGMPFRIQVVDDDVLLRTGDPCYDLDHRGYWGAGYLTEDATFAEIQEQVRDAYEEALDQEAMDATD